MKIETSAFLNGNTIPDKFTCAGDDVSPPFVFSDIPKETISFALIVDDPDAPNGTFDHWLAWNIPGNTRELVEGVQISNQGKNGFGSENYRGPCPPPGKPHRYFFKLYALDTSLDLPNGISKKQLENSMKDHILTTSELIGIYQR